MDGQSQLAAIASSGILKRNGTLSRTEGRWAEGGPLLAYNECFSGFLAPEGQNQVPEPGGFKINLEKLF